MVLKRQAVHLDELSSHSSEKSLCTTLSPHLPHSSSPSSGFLPSTSASSVGGVVLVSDSSISSGTDVSSISLPDSLHELSRKRPITTSTMAIFVLNDIIFLW